MSLVDVQVRRLGRKALEQAAQEMETVDISFERISGEDEASVSYFTFTAEDGKTKQQIPGIVLVVLAETQASIDAVAKRVLGHVPGHEE